MQFFTDLLVFSQNLLRALNNFGVEMYQFLGKTFKWNGNTYSVATLLFGSVFFVYIGVRLTMHLVEILIPN